MCIWHTRSSYSREENKDWITYFPCSYLTQRTDVQLPDKFISEIQTFVVEKLWKLNKIFQYRMENVGLRAYVLPCHEPP